MAGTANPSSLDLGLVIAALGALARRFDIDAIHECDSTNTRLLALAEAGAPAGSVLVADRQSAGRGRRGRPWHSSPGDSLTFSLLWRFAPDSAAPTGLSLAVGVAVARALSGLGIRDIALKWPNDILHGGRKLAGTLLELQPGNMRSAVIGIGLNLRLPAHLPTEIASTAVGLDALGRRVGREEVLAALLSHLAGTLDAYAVGGFRALKDEWLSLHAWQDRRVHVAGEGSNLAGTCIGVDDQGALLIATHNGVSKVLGGEISVRPVQGTLA